MLKLEVGECNHTTNSWSWIAMTGTRSQVSPERELHDSWILLVKVLEDHKSLEIIVESLDRLEKILGIWITNADYQRIISNVLPIRMRASNNLG